MAGSIRSDLYPILEEMEKQTALLREMVALLKNLAWTCKGCDTINPAGVRHCDLCGRQQGDEG